LPAISCSLGGSLFSGKIASSDFADFFRSADVGFANFETSVREYDEGCPSIGVGTFMTTEPKLLEDIKWLGINMVSCANNQVANYGEEGVLANIRHLDAYGIAYAGMGRNLREARSPGYLDTPRGRFALIAATSFFNEWHQAVEQRPDYKGKPGINPLGFQTSYIVDSQTMNELRRAGRALGFEAAKERTEILVFLVLRRRELTARRSIAF